MNENLKDAAMVEIEKLLQKGKDLLENEELRERADALKNKAEETIKKHPIKSVVIGLGIGYLIGKILKSNDD